MNSGVKVANLNADKLDGLDSSGLVQGKGQTYTLAVAIPRSQFFDSTEYVPSPAVSPGFFNVTATCPGLSSSTDQRLRFHNLSGSAENLFVRNNEHPAAFYDQLDSVNDYGIDSVDLTTATIQGGAGGVATVEISTAVRETDCHFQIQALITKQ